MASERSEHADAGKRLEHARAGAVGTSGFGGDDGSWRWQWQLWLHLHRAGPCAAATAAPDQGDPIVPSLAHPTRAIRLGAGATPAMRGASSPGSATNQAQVMHTCNPHINTSTEQKTSSWTNETLQQALDKIIDEGMKLKVAAKVFGIPSSSQKDHLYGRTTSRQRGTKSTLKAQEEKN